MAWRVYQILLCMSVFSISLQASARASVVKAKVVKANKAPSKTFKFKSPASQCGSTTQFSAFLKLSDLHQLTCEANYEENLVNSRNNYIECSRACKADPECIAFAFTPFKYLNTTGGQDLCEKCPLQNITGLLILSSSIHIQTWVSRPDLPSLLKRAISETGSG